MLHPLVRLSVCSATLTAVALCAAPHKAWAQSTSKIVTGEDGVRYLETTQRVPRPISKTDWEQHQQTVFRERYETQWHTNYRTYLTPVTEYRAELYLANRWNPLAMPYWTYRYVPVTRWESRAEPYSVPISQRTLVPEQQTVQIPRTTTQMATAEYVSRVPLGPATGDGWQPAGGGTAVARGNAPGGIKLNSDPPRTATGQSAGGTTLR
jgi:hypothetical protein